MLDLLGKSSDCTDGNFVNNLLSLGYATSINGTNAGTTESKRPKQGLEYHLFNVAALLAGVGLGGDVRCSTRLQSREATRPATRPKKYFIH